jgi:hypothetical protein
MWDQKSYFTLYQKSHFMSREKSYFVLRQKSFFALSSFDHDDHGGQRGDNGRGCCGGGVAPPRCR